MRRGHGHLPHRDGSERKFLCPCFEMHILVHSPALLSAKLLLHCNTHHVESPDLKYVCQGWKIDPKKPRFFKKNPKNLKSPKFCFFYFLVKFYRNHIKFHILIMIRVFCYILPNCPEREWIVYRMFFLGGNFVCSLICTLKSKKP